VKAAGVRADFQQAQGKPGGSPGLTTTPLRRVK
jgi:hypothetical protein